LLSNINILTISCDLCEAGGDGLWAGDRRTDDYGGGAQVKGPAYLLGIDDVTFY
jgi:hypothetical protein